MPTSETEPWRFVCHHCPAAEEYSHRLTEPQALFFLQLHCWRVVYLEHTEQRELICYACRLRLGEIKPYVKVKLVKRCKVCCAPVADCGCRTAALRRAI